jgi:tRNA threonylcarbamoyladenosine biosynthesis protein TsaB
LDASTYAGDVCLLDGTRVLAESQVAMKGAEEERLMPAVAAVLTQAATPPRAIERVICGAGPGSFTSLRIAAGIAKGFATGLRLPLYAVPSLALIVGGAELPAGDYLAALDALRGEYYVALYRVDDGGDVREVECARLVAAGEVEPLAAGLGARLVSPTRFETGVASTPRARAVARLGEWLATHDAVDLASWEPAYGRLAEAQVRWESAHGRALPAR